MIQKPRHGATRPGLRFFYFFKKRPVRLLRAGVLLLRFAVLRFLVAMAFHSKKMPSNFVHVAAQEAQLGLQNPPHSTGRKYAGDESNNYRLQNVHHFFIPRYMRSPMMKLIDAPDRSISTSSAAAFTPASAATSVVIRMLPTAT